MLQATNPLAVQDPQSVYQKESVKIQERRTEARRAKEIGDPSPWSVAPDEADDYVGLALSGGGIRAASLGLGVLQAFCKHKLIRSIDYLSTVSGGGYIGGHFSSAVKAKNVPPERAFEDIEVTPPADGKEPAESAGQPNDVRKLIYGGKYLYRPWEFANKYLIGLLLTNIAIFSGVVALAALVAFAWRLLDTVMVRDFLRLFNFNTDVVAAFLPFYVFFVCWFVAWLLSYFRFQAEAPGRWAQRWLYFAFAAALIGFVLLLVNGKETKLGFLSIFLGSGSKVDNTGTISKWLLGLLATALLPLLNPKKLIEMGMEQDKLWNRVVFRITTFALLVGVPLAFVGILGMRDVSKTSSDPHDNLRAGDIRNWPAFAAVLGGPYVPLTAEDARRMNELKLKAQPDINALNPHDARSYFDLRVRKLVEERDGLSAKMEQLEPSDRFDRFLNLVGWPYEHENPLRDAWRAQRRFEQGTNEVCDIFNQKVLPSRLLPIALVEELPLARLVDLLDAPVSRTLTEVVPLLYFLPSPALPLTAAILPSHICATLASSYLDPAVVKAVKDAADPTELADTKETLNDATLSYTTSWRPDEAKSFNQDVLRDLHPECFYEQDKAYRWIVTAGDEWYRLKVFGWASLVFVIAIGVDMNRTSLHRFYRNRLKRAYLVPQSPSRPDVNLSELNTTDRGAPYHLINTTLELTRPQFLDELDVECMDKGADRRDRQCFLFSQLYCGSTATGWIPTKEYESYLKENISLSDAMALSGAASDAMLANSLPVTLLMTALNLTLGQWMPNPRRGRPRANARASVLLRDWFRPEEESEYCFVCDGGFTDNLGILALLKRRCRLIIALDSTRDPKQQFADLGVVIRAARIQEGIKILEPGSSDQPLDTKTLARNEKGFCERHFLVARIVYPSVNGPVQEGLLLCLKPSFTDDEGSVLLDYRHQHSDFPHDPTSDQFYDDARFESYRELGFHIAEALIRELSPGEATTTLQACASALCEKLAKAAGSDRGPRPTTELADILAHIEAIESDIRSVGDRLRQQKRAPSTRAFKKWAEQFEDIDQRIQASHSAKILTATAVDELEKRLQNLKVLSFDLEHPQSGKRAAKKGRANRKKR